jgi:hypothetical protein
VAFPVDLGGGRRWRGHHRGDLVLRRNRLAAGHFRSREEQSFPVQIRRDRVTAIWVTLSVGRPGGSLAHRGLTLAVAPALLACAAVVELLVLPEGQWTPRLVGHNARFCLTLIPLLSIGPLACLLAALREGAPSSPGQAGAVAGLAASGIAATFYAANCNDDSALFVITWYPIAILIVTAAGYLIGRKLLRW